MGALRVQNVVPKYNALQWPPKSKDPPKEITDVPGVEKNERGEVLIRTKHRQLVKLGPGMWVIWDDGGHVMPCTDDTFRRIYERC